MSPYGSRDARFGVEEVDDASEARAEDGHDARLRERRRGLQRIGEGFGRLGDASIELRAVQAVGEGRQGPITHLHPLQQIGLLGLVLLGCDEALVAQAGEALELRADIVGWRRGGRGRCGGCLRGGG